MYNFLLLFVSKTHYDRWSASGSSEGPQVSGSAMGRRKDGTWRKGVQHEQRLGVRQGPGRGPRSRRRVSRVKGWRSPGGLWSLALASCPIPVTAGPSKPLSRQQFAWKDRLHSLPVSSHCVLRASSPGQPRTGEALSMRGFSRGRWNLSGPG